jgi:predicted phosphodiesterase
MVIDPPKDEVLSMMKLYKADVLLFGYSHKPFHKIIKDDYVLNCNQYWIYWQT